MEKLKAIHIVYANWCPHCVPTTVDPLRMRAAELGIPCLLHDIDIPSEELDADELVKKYGDWSADYLIPQVFFEYADGKFLHAMTGNPQGVALTRRAVEQLLASKALAV
jgi:thiol-disulfide isomerase/thioredoxin